MVRAVHCVFARPLDRLSTFDRVLRGEDDANTKRQVVGQLCIEAILPTPPTLFSALALFFLLLLE